MSEGPIIRLRGVERTYGRGDAAVQALKCVDLEVARGEFVAIMGPSGCGKSTLLHLLGGLLSPTSGNIIIDGEDLAKVSDAERTDIRRRKIGFVFQRFNLFPTLTADGNLKLAEKIHAGNGESAERRREVLSLLKLEEKMHHKPLELSGGEQQRVAIARAFANSPKILLADEPTGNLDSKNGTHIFELMVGLHEKNAVTLVLVTHDDHLAARADRRIVLSDGKVIEWRESE